MELINEILKDGFICDDWANPYARGVGEMLTKAVPCDITNVAEWLHANPPLKKSYTRISPMFVMPHDLMWFEYPVLEYSESVIGWKRFALLMIHASIAEKPEDPEDADVYAGAYVFVGRRNVRPKLLCAVLRFRQGENGQELQDVRCDIQQQGCIQMAVDGDLSNVVDDDEWVRRVIVKLALPGISALTFFHCPNVRISNRYPSRAHAAAFKQKHGCALRVMKTIDIHNPREQCQGSGQMSLNEARVPLPAHFVRGHFKRYNNLFGSISGVFFWRPHVRGEGEPLLRSYNVHGPTKEHHGKCLVEK